MAVLVTRPEPNQATADALRGRGFAPLLAPLLRFEALPLADTADATYSGVIITSANAVRAVAAQPVLSRLTKLKLFAVGEQTAATAREAGFTKIKTADGDAESLRALIVKKWKKKDIEPLLYLRADDISRDMAKLLAADGIPVESRIVYRMTSVRELSDDARRAFADDAVQAVLHYSKRSASAFVAAVQDAGLSVSALAVPQLCLSEAIAEVLRAADATRVVASSTPNEVALLDILERVLK